MGITLSNIQTGLLNQSSSQVIDGSLKFQRANANYLTRAIGSEGNRRTWTYSCWIKRDAFPGAARQLWGQVATAGASATGAWQLYYAANEALEIHTYSLTHLKTNAVYRDTGWYHVVQTLDTTSTDANSRVRLYINGVEQTSFATRNNPSENQQLGVNTVGNMVIGTADNAKSTYYIDAKMTQAYFVDGLSLGPGYFGFTDPLTGTWRPKKFRAEGTTVNDGTQWSSLVDVSNATVNNGSAANLFDGNTTTKINITGGYIEIDLSSRNVQAGPEGIEVYNNEGGAYTSYQVNGGEAINWQASAGWMSMGGANSKINTIRINYLSGGGVNAAFAFRVNGVVMKDSTTTNLDFGTNGFYLPMDGNSPIGQDKSGKGNNWTPVNFGGSAGVDQASGALPILEGAGGAIANVGVRTDAYAANLTLALPLVGSVRDESNRINSGSTTKVVTANNNAAASNNQSNFYNGSFYFDGTDDKLTIPNNTDFNFGSGDSTIEMWVYPTRISGTQENLITRGTSGYSGFIMSVTNFLDSTNGGSSWNVSITYDNPLVANVWQHIAVCRSGDTWTVYINGVANGSATASGTVQSSAETLTIGERAGQTDFQGYINDIRLYKGAAKYTENFIPASTNPDILPDTPSGVSGGSKLTKITEGAIALDGTGDYLSLADSADFDFGTGDYTAEAFVYAKSHADMYVINQSTDHGGAAPWWGLNFWSNGSSFTIRAGRTDGSGNAKHEFSFPWAINKWYHFAVSRSSGTSRCYLDGVLLDTQSDTDDIDGNGTLYIGAYNNAGLNWNGFISNVRIVKGTGLYTESRITPPTAPLTNVTNTKLLCCQSNTSANSVIVSPATFSNSGDVYSSGISGSQDNTNGGGSAAAFDGQLGNEDGYGSYPNAGQTLTWTAANSDLGTTLAYSSTIRVYVNVDANGDAGGLTVVGYNGSQTISAGSAGGRWVDISAATSPITSIAWSRAGSGSQGVTLVAVEVDGSLLIDGFNGEAIARAGDAAATNFNPFNTDINTVRGQETGYATMNPLDKHPTSATEDGNLVVSNTSNLWCGIRGTFGRTSGKFYYEVKTGGAGSGGESVFIGLGSDNPLLVTTNTPQNDNTTMAAGTVLYCDDGQKILDSSSRSSYGTAISNQDLIGVAYDLDNKTIEFFNDGISQGVIDFSSTVCGGANQIVFPYYISYYNSTKSQFNFGQKPFKFPPPDGFQPLNAANVRPEKVITRPDKYVAVTTYAGNATTQHINVGLRPDFVWIKERTDSGGVAHYLGDTVRGINKNLQSNTTQGEGTNNGYGYVSSVDDNGFTVTQGSSDSFYTNGNPETYVAWTWKAGGNKNTFNIDDVGYASAAAAGLDGGTATVTGASVGTKQGFSIIKYTTTTNAGNFTVSHGLSEAPTFIITRKIDSGNWVTGHNDLGWTKYLFLNTTAGPAGTNANAWGNISPTSSVFGGNDSSFYGNGVEQISYIWHDVPGLQKFGLYVGNNAAAPNGPFVELGFRPALVMIKRANGTGNWIVYDNKRDTFNPLNGRLYWNTSSQNVDNSGYDIDFLSNGFRITGGTNDNYNAASDYVYAAWAEAPTFNLYGAQSSAR